MPRPTSGMPQCPTCGFAAPAPAPGAAPITAGRAPAAPAAPAAPGPLTGPYGDPYAMPTAPAAPYSGHEHPGRPRQRTSGMAVTALVLGIAGFCLWVVLGPFTFVSSILAIVFGALGIAQCNRDPMLGGKGMAIAGLVLGAVQAGLALLALVFFASLFAGAGAF